MPSVASIASTTLLAALWIAPRVTLAQPEPAQPTPEAPPSEPGTPVDPPRADPPRAEPPKDADPPRTEPPPKDEEKPRKREPDPPKGGPPDPPEKKKHKGSFEFGSYGRVIAGMDGAAGPGKDADIVAHGSRLDESNYVEAELRRDDEWEVTNAKTHAVVTLAIANPLFHWNGEFDIKMAVRNLYLQEDDLGLEGLSVWAGSKMLRGDDIYTLDFWPLDNLNTIGGGVGYKHDVKYARLRGMFHVGVSRPEAPFYHQTVIRQAPLDAFGTVPVEILDRQRVIGSLRLEYNQRFSDPEKGPAAGLKIVGYGEGHGLPSGQRETQPKVYEDLPSDGGFVIGGELATYTGIRDTYVNVFFRYASGLAAYGQFGVPGQLAADKTTDGAREILVALGGNAEWGPIGVMLGAYVRSFRDASPALDYQDVDEGIVLARPSVFFGEIAGLSLEASYQLSQRGIISPDPSDPSGFPTGPRLASLFRFGVVPFLSPAGRGDYSRPHIRFIYEVTARDDDAKALYPEDHIFHRRDIEHFIGFGAEWWFNSSSYGN